MNTNAGACPPLAKVLLVDDEIPLLMMLERFLRDGGYAIVSAPSGEVGLNCFQQNPADIVVVDRAMPGMGGEAMARKIKALAPHVPILLITGFVDMVTDPHLFRAILAKPFHPRELVQLVADTLAASRLENTPAFAARRG